jgi:hypothetical protein
VPNGHNCRISDIVGCVILPALVSMVVAVTWFSGIWMPDQVQHDGVWGRTRLRAGIHDCGSGVVQWFMDAGSSPA